MILALTALLTGQGGRLFILFFGGLVFATVGTLTEAMIGAVLELLVAAIRPCASCGLSAKTADMR